MKKYGQMKLPELWTAQTFRGSTQVARQRHYTYMAWLGWRQKRTLTRLNPDPVEAAPGKETSPPPTWKKHTQECVLWQLLAPSEQADKWPDLQNSQVKFRGRRREQGASRPAPVDGTHSSSSLWGRTGYLRPGPRSVTRQFWLLLYVMSL